MIASARKSGYRYYEFRARLALAEIQQWSGSASAGAHLIALERDARAQGLLLIANQAHALSQAKYNVCLDGLRKVTMGMVLQAAEKLATKGTASVVS